MNKRIQELAEHARLLGPSSRIGNAHEAAERFAQLILEDVMSICEDLGDKSLDGHHCVDAIAKKYQIRQWSPH